MLSSNSLSITPEIIESTSSSEIIIGKTKLGANNPVFITAECGINNDGTLEQAIKLIDVAAAAECSAVKFQLFTAELMYTIDPGKYKTATGKMKPIWNLIKANELRTEWIPELKKHAASYGLEIFITVCDEPGGDTLDKLGMPAFKIASYEITHLPLIRHMAKKRKPIVFSSGGATLAEIDEAIRTIEAEDNHQIVHMHCMGQYPAKPSQANLNIITTLRTAFPHIIVGYSDHTIDPLAAPKAAVALGAKMIEKHITINQNLPGPDHSFAVDPDGLKSMVEIIRQTEAKIKKGQAITINPTLLGCARRRTYQTEEFVRKFCYRRIFATQNIKRGEHLTTNNIAILRSGNKYKEDILLPQMYDHLLGHQAQQPIKTGQGITWSTVLG